MDKMKTLTVNGKTYEICDPSAPRIDNETVGGSLWSSRQTVDRLCPKLSESGAAVACQPVEGYPLNVTSRIEPVQSGSGDPYPPGGGKNFLDIPSHVDFIHEYKKTGLCIPAGQYVVSCGAVSTDGSRGFCAIGFYNGDTLLKTVSLETDTKEAITFDAEATRFTIYSNGWDFAASVNVAATVDQLMVSLDGGEYAPYSNIRPITGHTSCNLYRSGKNLLDQPESLSFTRNVTVYQYIPKGTYILSCGNLTSEGARTPGIGFYNADAISFFNYTLSVNAEKTVTLTEDAYRYTILSNGWDYPASTGVNATVEQLMLRPASVTDASYAPYQGNTFTLDLGQTVYGGSLDWSTGVLTVDRLLHTLDGTEDWKTKTDSGCADGLYYYWCEFAVDHNPKDTSVGISSHYPYNTSKTAPGFWVEHRGWKKLGVRIVCAYETTDELAAFLAEQYAAGTPVQVCYQLATPITVQLMPTEILALSGGHTLYSDTGDTTVTGRADIAAIVTRLQETIAAQAAQINTLQTAAVNNA